MGQSKDIAEILRQRDAEKYRAIIERAELNGYHDFKHDRIPDHPEYAECICPKMQLVMDLSKFPELADITRRVVDGEFDESPDPIDGEEMRKWLLDDGAPDEMFKAMRFEPPSYAERFLHKKNKRSN